MSEHTLRRLADLERRAEHDHVRTSAPGTITDGGTPVGTPSDNPGVASHILKTGDTGLLTLHQLTVTNKLRISGLLEAVGAITLQSTLEVIGATTLRSTLNAIGGATLQSTLGVIGATTLQSTLGVTGATSLASTLGVTGAATFQSTLGVAGATTLQSTLNAAGATTLQSTLGVTGAATFQSTLGVTGTTSLASTLGVTGAATLQSTLGVTGATTLQAATTVQSTLTVAGTTTLQTNLNVAGAASLQSTLGVTGAATLQSSLDVTGRIRAVGNIVYDNGQPRLFMGISATDLNRSLWILNSEASQSAAGLKVGRLSVTDDYVSADPPMMGVTIKGRLGIGVIAAAAPLHILAATEQARFGFNETSYASLTAQNNGTLEIGTTAATPTNANLVLKPGGAIILHPTPSAVTADILPNANYRVNLGTITNKLLTVHAAELWVETLVAADTMATIGGRVLVGPTTTLTRDLTAVATTVYIKHNQWSNGDVVYLQTGVTSGGTTSTIEFMQVTSVATTISAVRPNTEYSYTVTRNLDGTGANTWVQGDAVFNTGNTGNGFIDLYSLRGMKYITEAGTDPAQAQYGPTIAMNVRNSATFNDWSEHAALGNLRGLYGYATDTYGVGLGKYTTASGSSYITIDAANGYRIHNGPNVIGQWDAAGVVRLGTDAPGNPNVFLSSGQMHFRQGTTNKISLDTGGNLSVSTLLYVAAGGSFGIGATGWAAGSGAWSDIQGPGSTARVRIGNPTGQRMSFENGALTIVGEGGGITNINGANIQTGTIVADKISVLAAGNNLLYNSAFEAVPPTDGWTFGGSGSSIHAVYTDALPIHGHPTYPGYGRSYMVANGQNYANILSTKGIGYVAGSTHVVSVWMLSSGSAAPSNSYLRLRCHNSSGTYLGDANLIAVPGLNYAAPSFNVNSVGYGSWTRWGGKATPAQMPAGTTNFFVEFYPTYLQLDGTFYLSIYWTALMVTRGDVVSDWSPSVSELLPGTILATHINVANLAAIKVDTGSLNMSGFLTIGAAGGIYQGSGSPGAPSTGLKLWNEAGVGRIAGFNAGVEQWSGRTDGKLYAGAGNLKIDSGGITIHPSASFSSDRAYTFESPTGFIYGSLDCLYNETLFNRVTLSSEYPGNGFTETYIEANGGAGQSSSVYIAARGSGTAASIHVSKAGSGANSITITGPLTLNDGIVAQARQFPTLLNGWVNYGSGYAAASYWKDAFGVVHLEGLLAGGATGVGTGLFQLPVGYRPPARMLFSAGSTTMGRADVDSIGLVTFHSGSNSFFSIDGIHFRTT